MAWSGVRERARVGRRLPGIAVVLVVVTHIHLTIVLRNLLHGAASDDMHPILDEGGGVRHPTCGWRATRVRLQPHPCRAGVGE